MASDYISREAAIEIVINYEFENCPDYMRDFATKLKSAVCSDIRTDLQAIPAEDVRPVVHGKWIRVDYEPCGHDYICSECVCKSDGPWNFCHDCGAEMENE